MSATANLERIETARLVCVRPTADTDPLIVRHLRDPRIARTMSPTGEPLSEAELLAALLAKDAHWRRHGFGLWALLDRSTGAFVGRGGLQHTTVTGHDQVEVGWSIVPERWGEGLATELAQTSVDAGFQTLGLNQLIAYARRDNLASRRVMEKAGFRYERELEHAGGPHVLYRRARC